MAALVTVSYDRPAYAPGDLMTVTLTGEWFKLVNGTATAEIDGTSVSASAAVIHPVEFTDDAGRVYELQSNDGQTAVFTAEA